MRYLAIILFGLTILTACAPDKATVALQQLDALKAKCDMQFSPQPPTMAANQKCKNDAADATTAPYFPYPDLFQLAHAEKLEIADQADHGQITVDQANVEMAQVTSQMAQEIENRNNQTAEANAANQAASAQSLSAIANIMGVQRPATPSIQPYFLPTQPVQPIVTTNCMGFGNQVNCTSR